MTDDELLRVPGAPDYPTDAPKKVRSYRQDHESAIEAVLSKYVPESCYDDAKRALEGATDAFDGVAALVDDLETACRALDDHAVVTYGCAYDALCKFAPQWRDEVRLEHVEALA